jgi:hypothetical protein
LRGEAAAGRGGLGLGGLLVWTICMAFSISPLTKQAKACRLRSMEVSINIRCSGAGFFKTQ